MKGFKWYLFIFSILIVAYILVQYFKPQPTNWKPTYLSNDKIPFGTYLLRERIHDIFPGTQVKVVKSAIYNALKDKNFNQSNFLIIASSLEADEYDYQEMLNYMQRGNNIFIAAFQIKGKLKDTLKIEFGQDYSFSKNRKWPINFTNPSLKREYDYYFDKGISNQFFGKFDTTKAIVLGEKNGDRANFIQYKYGKGSLFIIPNPQLLTNYALLKEDGRDYAAKALSYLPKTQTLIWDEHFTRTDVQDQSMLRVFFSNDSLRWAYNIAIFSLLIFVVYEIKRRQRVIPVIEPLKNTSVEFVNVVGQVYYQQRNNRDIVEKKLSYLLAYIRNKYRLKTTVFDQEFKENLARISGASADVLEDLFNIIEFLNHAQSINDDQLIRINKTIEQFYKQDR